MDGDHFIDVVPWREDDPQPFIELAYEDGGGEVALLPLDEISRMNIQFVNEEGEVRSVALWHSEQKQFALLVSDVTTSIANAMRWYGESVD